MTKRRVVVTGVGIISPLGLNVVDTWEKIKAGQSGVATIETFDVTEFSCKIVSQVKNFDITRYISPKEARKMDIFVQYAVAGSAQAMDDSGLELDKEDLTRIGVAIGSGIGGLPSIVHSQGILEKRGPRRVSPFFIPGSIINMAAGSVSIRYGLQGPNVSIVTACTTGSHNIGFAARTIAYGDADVMVAGGAEMANIPLGLGGFAALRSLSTRNGDPERASRPWDKDRDGFILGDGAGVLILEEYERAKARNANIYAELVGIGMSADASHMTSPSQKGMELCMHNALKDAGLPASDIQYINAHATSTYMGDPIEAQAVRQVFASHADKLCVSSTKSMTGHLLGATGAVEAIFCLLALRDQIVPPTINLDNPDEGCDLDFVPHTARDMQLDTVLSNSFGFGGTNGSLIFKKI